MNHRDSYAPAPYNREQRPDERDRVRYFKVAGTDHREIVNKKYTRLATHGGHCHCDGCGMDEVVAVFGSENVF